MSEHEQRIRDAVGMVGSWADEHYITAARNDLRALLDQRLDAAIRTSEGGAGRGMTHCTILRHAAELLEDEASKIRRRYTVLGHYPAPVDKHTPGAVALHDDMIVTAERLRTLADAPDAGARKEGEG